jgi:hypothetical protein
MSNGKPISRRTVLRGLGAAVCLPFLESLAPRALASAAGGGVARVAAKRPVRMAVLYMANGVNVSKWVPQGFGRDFALSPTLSPLAPLKDDLLVLTELMNRAATGGDGHYVKSAGLLTGTTITKTTGKDIRAGGVSMDQLAAQKIGHLTPLPSLELGVEPVETGVDGNVGYTRLYSSHISWATPTTPVGKEINPRLAFDRLFRSNARAEGDNRSVLDLVGEQAKAVRSKAGGADQAKLDNYLESIRAVEKRIDFNSRQRAEEHKLSPEQLTSVEAMERRITEFMGHPDRQKLFGGGEGGHGGRRGILSTDHSEHVRLMLDLMVLGFWSDSTRIATFMFGNAVSGRNFSFLPGVRGGHHEISHHKNEEKNLEQYQKINQWHVEQYAYMLGRMKEIKDGPDGATLLDNSMVLFGSCMRDGNAHDPRNLPLLLAGKGGGTIATGRHLVYEKNTPLCNLYTAMLDRLGAPAGRFGDSTGPLAGLDDPTSGGTGVG